VGNIPYDATEEQLVDVFKEVGPVVSFRLVFDRETGKPKGYGFCEFRDSATALSAVRNLNGRELNGRNLRVDFAEYEKHTTGGGPGAPGASGGDKKSRRSGKGSDAPKSESAPPSTQPSGTPEVARYPPVTSSFGAYPGATGEQQVTGLLESFGTHQLLDLVTQMKLLIEQQPEQARALLYGNPQFCYALLQSQVILGMIDATTAQQLFQKAISTPPVPPSASVQGSTLPGAFESYMMPPAFPLVSQMTQSQQPQAPTVSDETALLLQVMQLTQQIDMLPPEQRLQLQHLQQQIKHAQLTGQLTGT